jgi:hypothetical protein
MPLSASPRARPCSPAPLPSSWTSTTSAARPRPCMPCPPSSAGSDAISARRSLLRPSTIATRDGWRKPRRCWRRPPDLWPSQVQGPGFRTSPRRPASGSSWAPMPPRPGPSPCLAMPWPRPGAPTRHTARQQARALQQHDPGARHVGHELGVATGKVPVRCRSRAWTHPWGRQGSGWQRRRHGGRQRHHGVGSLRPPRWLGLVASFHDRARGCHMRLRKRLPPCRPAFPRWIPTVQGQGMRRDDGTATACTRCWVARLLVTSD